MAALGPCCSCVSDSDDRFLDFVPKTAADGAAGAEMVSEPVVVSAALSRSACS